MKNCNKEKIKSHKILVSFIFLFFVVAFIFSGCVANTDYSYLTPTDYTPTTATIFVDDLGHNSIRLNEERDVKILQLTDLHIGNGILCVKKDKRALEDMCAVIEASNPDLIIITGDLVYPIRMLTGTNDNLSGIKVIARIIEKYKTPWTITFGNHDAEHFAKYSKAELCDYLESDELEYCLFQRGPSNIDGMGNHIVNIYNHDNTINSSMIMIDNGEYKHGHQLSGYASVSQNQTDWYTESLEEINEYFQQTVQSFIFVHVPSREYLYAWQEYRSDNLENVEYFYGWANEPGEKISCPQEDSPLFDAILEIGSTKGIFCGHNHLNDFSISYKGVRLTFGQAIDYIAYPGIISKVEQRGGTILTLRGLNSSMIEDFDITALKVIDLN